MALGKFLLGSIGTLLCTLEFPPEGSLLGSCGSGKFSFWLHHFVSCTQSTVTLPAVIVLLSAWLMYLFSGTMSVSAVLVVCMPVPILDVEPGLDMEVSLADGSTENRFVGCTESVYSLQVYRVVQRVCTGPRCTG